MTCYRKFLNNKLWRDESVNQVTKDGSIIHWYMLDDESYTHQLKQKLLEEVDEVLQASTRGSLAEEFADILEVIESLCKIYNLTLNDIQQIQEKKRQLKGSFSGRKFVTIAEHPVGGPSEAYCLKSPDKYPEILD